MTVPHYSNTITSDFKELDWALPRSCSIGNFVITSQHTRNTSNSTKSGFSKQNSVKEKTQRTVVNQTKQSIRVIYHHYRSVTWCSSMTHLLYSRQETKDGFAPEELWKSSLIVNYRIRMDCSGRISLRNRKFLKINSNAIDIEVNPSFRPNIIVPSPPPQPLTGLNPEAPLFVAQPTQHIPRALKQLQSFNKPGLKE